MVRSLLVSTAALHMILSFASIVFCVSYYAFEWNHFADQLRDRMIFDVMSLAACLLIIVPASGSAAVLLQLSLSLLRIVFFLDVSESITALLLNVKKTELLAILSWISSSDLDKGRYMTSSGCCGIFEANYGYHITNDSLLCTSYRNECCLRNGTAVCCEFSHRIIRCRCYVSCLPTLSASLRKVCHLVSGIGLLSCAIKVLSTSYELLKSVDLHERPLNDSVANGFALVFENTPFLLELAVFFPDVVHEHLDNQDSLIQVLHWATNLTLQSGLLSESDRTLFDSGQMELNLIPRSADYSNPHTVHQKMLKEKWAAELRKEEIRKNKRKLKKGPRLAGHRFDL